MNESIEELMASGAVVPDRPGSKRLVPAAQSVVVRRADLEEVRDLLMERIYGSNARSPGHNARLAVESMLAAAPAPSSLAGGEVTDEWADRFCEAVNWSPDGQECKTVEGELRCTTFRQIAKGHILSAIATNPYPDNAALSPEAPARKGVESFDNVEARAEAWSDRAEIQRMVEATTGVFAKWSSPEILSRFRQQFMAVVQQAYIEGYDAALTPRHEAPECDDCGSPLNSDGECTRDLAEREADDRHEAPAEGAGEVTADSLRPVSDETMRALLSCKDVGSGRAHLASIINDLRASSSAPEAREGEAWTEDMERERREADYERGFRHGKESAFDDAGSEPVAWRGRDPDAFGDGAWAVCSFKPSCDVIEPLFTHPAAPSADKLRTALSEIRDGMVASRDCISVDEWIELADKALSTPDALKGDAK